MPLTLEQALACKPCGADFGCFLTSFLTLGATNLSVLICGCRPLTLERVLALKKEFPHAKMVVGNTGGPP